MKFGCHTEICILSVKVTNTQSQISHTSPSLSFLTISIILHTLSSKQLMCHFSSVVLSNRKQYTVYKH